MQKLYLFCASIASILLAGCVSKTITSADSTAALSNEDANGPVYYLPKTLLIIEGGPGLGQKSASGKKKTASNAGGTSVNVDVTATNTVSTGGAASGSSGGSGGKAFGISIKTMTVADRDQRFVARFDLGSFSTDKPVVKVSDGGLLTSADFTAQDDARDAIVGFGQTLGLVAGLSSGTTSSVGFHTFASTDLTRVEEKPAPFKMVCEVAGAGSNGVLSGQLECNRLGRSADPAPTILVSGLPDTCVSQPGSATLEGLHFRSKASHLVTVTAATAGKDYVAYANVPIIDPCTTFTVAPERRAFATSKATLTFDQGTLLGYDAEYPSTAGSIVSLPGDFIGGIFTGIGNALSLTTNATTSEAALINAQASLLEAEAALEAARAERAASPNSD